MKKCIVADDHPLFREAICQVLKNHYPGLDIVQAEDIVSLQTCLSQHQAIDLILLDLHMPGAYGFSALAYVLGEMPETPTLVVSAHEKPDVMLKAVQYGAKGFLNKSANMATIVDAINTVITGSIYLPDVAKNISHINSEEDQTLMDAIASLTPQQYLVLTMLAQGLLNKQIAYELDITEATVKAHITAIFRKLGVRSRTQTVLAISRLGLEPPQDTA